LFVEDGIAFYSGARTTSLVFRSVSAPPKRIPVQQGILFAASCGGNIIAVQLKGGSRSDIVWLDEQGRVVGPVPGNGRGHFAICNSDGSVIFYGSVAEPAGVQRCDRRGCQMIFSGAVGWLALSPDEKRLALAMIDAEGAAFRWISSDGTGAVHEIADTENACVPIWSNDRDLWVSLRKGRKQVWTEIDTDTRQPTGRTAPGSRDCSDGIQDPQRPLHAPVEVDIDVRSQVRLLPSKYLPAG